MINFLRLNHVEICIPKNKEAEAKNFYANILGLKQIEKPEVLKHRGGLWFEIADIQLHIGSEENMAKSKRHPAFEVKNINSVKNYLEKNNVKIEEEIEIPGMDRFSIFDPFDNRIELIELILE